MIKILPIIAAISLCSCVHNSPRSSNDVHASAEYYQWLASLPPEKQQEIARHQQYLRGVEANDRASRQQAFVNGFAGAMSAGLQANSNAMYRQQQINAYNARTQAMYQPMPLPYPSGDNQYNVRRPTIYSGTTRYNPKTEIAYTSGVVIH